MEANAAAGNRTLTPEEATRCGWGPGLCVQGAAGHAMQQEGWGLAPRTRSPCGGRVRERRRALQALTPRLLCPSLSCLCRYQELEELSKELYDAAYEAAGGVVEPPAAANTRTTLSAPAFLPRYALVGARPAVADWAADGGVEVLAYDWASGRWSRDMSVLTAVMAARTSPDVHALTAAQFERHAPPRP